MDYYLFTDGKFTGYTVAESSQETLNKCEQLRNRQRAFIRINGHTYNRALGVIQGGKSK